MDLQELIRICKKNCKFSVVSEVSCLIWESDGSFTLASPSSCSTQGEHLSFEFSEPVHPCRAESLCKRTEILEQLHFWHSSSSMGATLFKGCQIKLLLHFITKAKSCCFCTCFSLRKGVVLTPVIGVFQRGCSCRQQECLSTLTQLFLDGHM